MATHVSFSGLAVDNKDLSSSNFALAGRLAIIIFVLFLASKESNVFALVGRLDIFVLFLASKESNVLTLAGRLAIIIFVLFLPLKESNVFFVLSIII